MSEIEPTKSGSDVSAGSWTLLEDEDPDEINKLSQTSSKTSAEIVPEDVPIPLDDEEGHQDGFLTFDEYLQERILEHDYEFDEKPEKLKKHKKSKKETRKCKGNHLGISIFIAIILTLTAFATLCSTLSQPTTEIRKHRISDKINHETIVNDMTKKLRLVEEAKITPIEKKKEEMCPPLLIGPQFANVTRTMARYSIDPKKPPSSTSIPEDRRFLRFAKDHAKTFKSKWIVLKELLLDTNVHAMASLIMTNIYIFTLLIEITRRHEHKLNNHHIDDLEQCITDLSSIEELRRCFFRQLPFWNEPFDDPPVNNVKVKSFRKLQKQLGEKLQESKKFTFKSCPTLVHINEVKPSPSATSENQESGKTECQRRFDELDNLQRKYALLKQSQRDRVKLLKQKFKNEVSFIRDTEEEAEARAEKINLTSQRFIRKLKFNREKYLMELRKVKQMREKAKLMAMRRRSCKEVAVGSYAVSIPSIYDFRQSFLKLSQAKLEDKLSTKWKFNKG